MSSKDLDDVLGYMNSSMVRDDIAEQLSIILKAKALGWLRNAEGKTWLSSFPPEVDDAVPDWDLDPIQLGWRERGR